MAIQFPTSPTIGDTYAFNGITWRWTGVSGAGSDNASFPSPDGASGAVRIIWGPNRAFPSTNTGDL